MQFFIVYAILVVLSLSVYLFSKGYLVLNDFQDCYRYLMRVIGNKMTLSKNDLAGFRTSIAHENLLNTDLELKKSLKHLEFIGAFESYLDESKDGIFSVDFLHELEESKFNTQVSILRTTGILNPNYKKQAA